MFGPEDSPAKTSPLPEWDREPDFEALSQDSFTNFLDWLQTAAPELSSSRTFQDFSLPMTEEISKSLFKLWPNSGIAWDGVCLTAKTSESPSHAKESSLLDAIETGEVPQKYFLSPNAARGITRRADRMGRVLFPPLRKALEILSKGQ